MNFYKHYIGDFQRDTGHLSLTERGAYRAMLDHLYATERPLPEDTVSLCRLVGAVSKEEKNAVIRILSEFWEKVEGGYINQRAVKEIGKADHQREVNRKIAVEREASKKQHESFNEHSTNRSTNDQPNQTPDTRRIKTPPLPPKGASDGFDRFWVAYPKKVGKGAAEKAWKKAKINGHAADVIAAVELQKQSEQWRKDGGQFVPNPATWLNQRRWEDELPGSAPTGQGNPLFQGMI